MNLYVTADAIGNWTGGGQVTYHESEIFKTLGETRIVERRTLRGVTKGYEQEPWRWDALAENYGRLPGLRLAHFYSGTFSLTAKALKEQGCKVTYTIAAHDKDISRQEHEKHGLSFPYPHLTEEPLWQRYIEGYRLADVIICPSQIAAQTVRAYGPEFANKRIEIIPHGCYLPEKTVPPPRKFVVGYLGAVGMDKGLRYLFEAWGKLKYKPEDAVLVIAGQDSHNAAFFQQFCPDTAVRYVGWQPNISTFYNGISLYVQPSATEGFGIEVLEAMSHKRPVICSLGAGASDLLPSECCVPARDSDALAARIDLWRTTAFGNVPGTINIQDELRLIAEEHTWPLIRQQYVKLWQGLLA